MYKDANTSTCINFVNAGTRSLFEFVSTCLLYIQIATENPKCSKSPKYVNPLFLIRN